MHRIIYKQKPTSFLNVPAQPMVFKTQKDLVELKDLPMNDGVIIGSVLQELPLEMVGPFLKKLGATIISGGSIYISGIDNVDLSRAMYNNETDMVSFNKLMFGESNKSIWNILTIETMMDQIGFSPVLKKMGGIGHLEYFYIGRKK